jgi:hypothetical protein
MKTAFLTLAAVAAFAAPATARPAQHAAPESITYGTGPCMGGCPIYHVTVRSDGTGTFVGVNFTTVRGTRNFRLTARQYQAFANHLAPIRPARGSINYDTSELCREMATDMPSATVTWNDRRGEQRLNYYYGCDMQRYRELARRLSRAPDLLPIGDFIGHAR